MQEFASKVVLFESLYFVLFIPSGINHVILSFSEFTFIGFNLYTGASFLLQGLIIFPTLFSLSRKLNVNKATIDLRVLGVAATLYVFVIWIKHAFFWFFALSPLGGQSGSLLETIGTVNSLLTLMVLIISVWIPVYSSFLGLTEFWMVSLLILGIVVMLKTRH